MSRTIARILTLAAGVTLMGALAGLAGCETPVPKADPALGVTPNKPADDTGGGGNVDPEGGEEGTNPPAGSGTGS